VLAFVVRRAAGGFPHTKHNDLQTFVMLYLVPSGVWLLVPYLGISRTYAQLTSQSADKPKRS
jgi:hypothetical protein